LLKQRCKLPGRKHVGKKSHRKAGATQGGTTGGVASAVAVGTMAALSWLTRRGKKGEPPAFMRCPVTHELMEDPVVVCTTGQTYERSAVETWFNNHRPPTDPATNVVLTDTRTVPNWALREAINEWRSQHGIEVLPPPASQPTLPSGAQPTSRGRRQLESILAKLLPIMVVLLAAVCGRYVALVWGANITGPVYVIVLLAVFWALEMDNRLRHPRPLAHFVPPGPHW